MPVSNGWCVEGRVGRGLARVPEAGRSPGGTGSLHLGQDLSPQRRLHPWTQLPRAHLFLYPSALATCARGLSLYHTSPAGGSPREGPLQHLPRKPLSHGIRLSRWIQTEVSLRAHGCVSASVSRGRARPRTAFTRRKPCNCVTHGPGRLLTGLSYTRWLVGWLETSHCLRRR